MKRKTIGRKSKKSFVKRRSRTSKLIRKTMVRRKKMKGGSTDIRLPPSGFYPDTKVPSIGDFPLLHRVDQTTSVNGQYAN